MTWSLHALLLARSRKHNGKYMSVPMSEHGIKLISALTLFCLPGVTLETPLPAKVELSKSVTSAPPAREHLSPTTGRQLSQSHQSTSTQQNPLSTIPLQVPPSSFPNPLDTRLRSEFVTTQEAVSCSDLYACGQIPRAWYCSWQDHSISLCIIGALHFFWLWFTPESRH